ncbi:MAG: GNAT family N-acetyltransferase [Holophagaceae bacterium]|nr:GNAT family N-acetyltransferase [Holophagaceae bacterium]
MSESVEFLLNKASEAEISDHLSSCDTDFLPPLSSRVEINDYAKKIMSKAVRFEAWSGGILVGLVAAYCNDQQKRIAYITSVSVLKAWMGKGIAAGLMELCIEHMKVLGMRQISLEVAEDNTSAVKLYEKSGFLVCKVNAPFVTMDLPLENGDEHEP